MAYPQFQIVQDDTTVLFDMNDETGATNYNGLKTVLHSDDFDLGDSPLVTATFEGEQDGGFVVHKRRGFATAQWRMGTLPASSDQAFTESIGYLGQLLEAGGTIRFQKSATAEARWMDFLPAPAPALFRGQPRSLFKVLTLLRDPDGVIMLVRRQPYFRGPMRDGAMNNMLVNPMMLLDSTDNGQPDGWTAAAGTHSIVAADDAYQNSHTAAVNLLTQNVTASSGQTWTFSVEARVVSGSGDARITAASVGGTGSTASALATTSAWTKLTATVTLGGATTAVQARLEQVNASGTTVLQFRKAQLEEAATAGAFVSSAVAVPNDPNDSGGRVLLGYIDGDLPTPVHVKVKGDTGSKIQEILVASQSRATGHRWLADYANTTKWVPLDADANGWDQSFPTGSETTAVGGAARIAYTADPTVSKKRVRVTRTTKLDSLRGEFDVWLRGSPLVSPSAHYMRLGWSPSTVDPVAELLDEVLIDVPSGITTFGFVDTLLGRIAIPEDTRHVISGFGVELHARRASGTGSFDADFLYFVPVDEFNSTIYVPGGSTERWLGNQLVTPVTNPAGGTAGTVSETAMILNNTTDNAGTPPQTGFSWPAGRHILTFDLDMLGVTNTTTVRVRNITDSTTSVSKSVTAKYRTSATIQFDSVAAKSYQPQVNAYTASPASIGIYSIAHKFIPYLAANESAHAEPEDQTVHKLDSNLDLVSYLKARGDVPIWLNPGPFCLSSIVGDVIVENDFPGLNSVLTRAAVWSLEYPPRYSQP